MNGMDSNKDIHILPVRAHFSASCSNSILVDISICKAPRKQTTRLHLQNYNNKNTFSSNYDLENSKTRRQTNTVDPDEMAQYNHLIGSTVFSKSAIDMSRVMRKPTFWFPTWSNTNRAVQLQKMARGLKFRIQKVEGSYYQCSENKGADQLCGYRTTDQRLCFRICEMLVFS